MVSSTARRESAEEIACKLHVRMLPAVLDDVDVYRIFAPYGIVHDIRMPPPANKTMKTRFAFVTYTRAFMADMAKRSLDGTTAVTTEYANIQLETPLRVDVYVPYEQLPAKVTPLLPVNALPPKPLLDFKSMSAAAGVPSERQLPPAPVTMASRIAGKTKETATTVNVLDGKAILKRAMLSTDEPTGVVLASFRTPYDMHVRLKSDTANYEGVFSELQRTLSMNMPVGHRYWRPLSIVAVHCSSHAAAIDGSLAPSEGDAEMMSIRDEWHRAVIVSAEVLPVLSSSRYVCRLLDTGVTVRVTHEHVRQLPTTAAFLAAQAIHVSLADVKPSDSSLVWPSDVSIVCRDWLTNVNADMKAVVVDRNTTHDNIYWPLKQLVRFVSHGDLFANNVALLDSVLITEELAVKAVLDDVPSTGKLDKLKSYTRRAMLAMRPKEAAPVDAELAAVIGEFNKMVVEVA